MHRLRIRCGEAVTNQPMARYPTEPELDKIREWPHTDPLGWLDFIRSVWGWENWGWHRTQRRLYFSTGGWSGNEDIIGAMRDNWILWHLGFTLHRRGGHFVFDLTRMRELQSKEKRE